MRQKSPDEILRLSLQQTCSVSVTTLLKGAYLFLMYNFGFYKEIVSFNVEHAISVRSSTVRNLKETDVKLLRKNVTLCRTVTEFTAAFTLKIVLKI
jgi:hypothetical protein